MINDGINDVPDKTIAIFRSINSDKTTIPQDRVFNVVKKPTARRNWFTDHFYRCLPLVIGNQYGFTISLEFDVGFIWNGGENPEDTFLIMDKKIIESKKTIYPNISSHFGHGILTINTPFFFRTPPGVNLMTINPPNTIVPNVTVMTGVVEADNLRRNFGFNLKIQIPEIEIFIPAGTPLAAFVPIPRYYGDKFELKMAEEIFNQEIIDEELKADTDAGIYRKDVETKLKHQVGRHYFTGKDIYGNEFKDHQK